MAPTPIKVATFPETVAMVGSAIVKLQAPGELEGGGVKTKSL